MRISRKKNWSTTLYARRSLSLLLIALCVVFTFQYEYAKFWDNGNVDLDVSPPRKDEESIVYHSCLEETLLSLPIGKGPSHKRKNLPDNQLMVFAHHYDARNLEKWNQDIRFEDVEELRNPDHPCTVWEVGAHKKADDSNQLMKKYPNCEYHGYEPIPAFFAALSKKWEGRSNMHLHNYGLASEDGEFRAASSVLHGQGTYIGDASKSNSSSDGNGYISAAIKSFDFAVKEAGSKPTLLHMNCEGCEWDLLSQDLEKENSFVSDIPVIQIGFHNYGEVGLGKRVLEYCDIRKKMSRTHRLVGAVPFAWERWVLKED